MSIKCCHKCVPPKRTVGCHATCPDYIAEKKLHDEKREEQQKQRRISDGVYDQRASSVRRARKRHGIIK